MYTDLKTLCLQGGCCLREAMAQMDQSRLGIVLVVDRDWRLVGTITDGDVRRAILASVELEVFIEHGAADAVVGAGQG